MKILPILWGSPPTPADWKRLSAAREAIGYEEQVKPAVALPGSPGRILAVASHPTWLCPYLYVSSTEDELLNRVLLWCLDENKVEPFPQPEDMIVKWSGGTFKFVGEEPVDA
jgi:hypothetical protein